MVRVIRLFGRGDGLAHALVVRFHAVKFIVPGVIHVLRVDDDLFAARRKEGVRDLVHIPDGVLQAAVCLGGKRRDIDASCDFYGRNVRFRKAVQKARSTVRYRTGLIVYIDRHRRAVRAVNGKIDPAADHPDTERDAEHDT